VSRNLADVISAQTATLQSN